MTERRNILLDVMDNDLDVIIITGPEESGKTVLCDALTKNLEIKGAVISRGVVENSEDPEIIRNAICGKRQFPFILEAQHGTHESRKAVLKELRAAYRGDLKILVVFTDAVNTDCIGLDEGADACIVLKKN